jgi:23S rRNA (cytosine1962-C5)-methyltransferase
LKPKEEDRLLAGHPWVFANEVDSAPKVLAPGSLVEVITAKGKPVGRGVASPTSKILIRLLTHSFDEELDEAFIAQRVGKALAVRKDLFQKCDTDGMRLLFGEADGLPGILVDGFGKDHAVLSCFSAGMKPFLPAITQALQAAGYRHIFEKSAGDSRQKEGMAESQGWLTEPGKSPMPFHEGKAKFMARPEQGQKTGFYLDFREVRRRIFEMSKGRKILDAFSYTGAASIQAALGGAKEVTALDSSQAALDEGTQSAELNGVSERVRFEKADSFHAMKDLIKTKVAYDGIILDPPPLAKSVHELSQGRLAFKRMMAFALDLLNPGGYIVAASCSHHFSWTVLEGVAREAVEERGRSFRLVERVNQPQDHPIVLSIPETEYLRVLILEEVI